MRRESLMVVRVKIKEVNEEVERKTILEQQQSDHFSVSFSFVIVKNEMNQCKESMQGRRSNHIIKLIE